MGAPVSAQRMVAMLDGQGFALKKRQDNVLKYAYVHAAFLHPRQVFPELRRLLELFHRLFHSAKASSGVSNVLTSMFRSLFFKVAAVSLLGIATSKGSPFRRITCLKKIRIASDDERPIFSKTVSAWVFNVGAIRVCNTAVFMASL